MRERVEEGGSYVVKRRLFNLLAAVSGVRCLATGALAIQGLELGDDVRRGSAWLAAMFSILPMARIIKLFRPTNVEK